LYDNFLNIILNYQDEIADSRTTHRLTGGWCPRKCYDG